MSAGASDRPRPPRVVVLTTFPVDHPRGGGQLRARHLYGGLAALGAEVEVLALGSERDAPGPLTLDRRLTQITVRRSEAHLRRGEEESAAVGVPVTDLVAGLDVAETPAYLDLVARHGAAAEIVVLAEPYLQPALEAAGLDRPWVYDAYNVERDLKAAILPDTPDGRRLLDEVTRVERRAHAGADLIVACSEEVAAGLAAAYGPPSAPVVVVPNGTEIPDAGPLGDRHRTRPTATRRALRALSRGAAGEAAALFMGSWHPPNIDAAEALVGLAAEVPELTIIGAGHHGVAFDARDVPPNLVFLGEVGDARRRTLLAHVDLALNPMRIGSGTNLKVLEDLAWEIPTISTPFGVRGLDLRDGEHLVLAEVDAMAAAVRALRVDPDRRARAERGRAQVARTYAWPRLAERFADALRSRG